MRFKADDLWSAAALLVLVTLVAWAWLPLGVGLAVALGVLAAFGVGRDVRRALDDHDRQTEARLWLAAVLEPRAPLPAMRGWAVSPDLASAIVEHVLEKKPRRVVECGSGASTVALGYALEAAGGGTVVALEHDAAWAERTARSIRVHGLEATARVVHAPLETVEVDGEPHAWYRLPELDGPIDLLVIDGPPVPPASRYPSIPLLADRLAPGAVVFLDDARRREGRENLERWGRRPGAVVEPLKTEKGAAILRGLGGAPPA